MAEKKLNKFYILNIGISAIDMDDACSLIEEAILKRQKKYICVCPVSTIMECKRNERVFESVNSADLVTPDGMPTVWIGKMHGYKNIRRVYGPDLMQRVCDISKTKGYKNYFYGSGEDVLNKLKTNLSKGYPGLVISGVYSPPFRRLTEEEEGKMVESINSNDPDIIWVGLGSPKQDLWMYEHRDRINAPVMVGVGAAFDFLAGVKPQAPRWIRNSGFEWLFRLITEPKRLWRRYLIDNPLFIYHAGIELFLRIFVSARIKSVNKV
jgi:N-acetylglucosaminyldiphosphoundecaprenol N-acetyl-beta-D-mannosaminyltransferase